MYSVKKGYKVKINKSVIFKIEFWQLTLRTVICFFFYHVFLNREIKMEMKKLVDV